MDVIPEGAGKFEIESPIAVFPVDASGIVEGCPSCGAEMRRHRAPMPDYGRQQDRPVLLGVWWQRNRARPGGSPAEVLGLSKRWHLREFWFCTYEPVHVSLRAARDRGAYKSYEDPR